MHLKLRRKKKNSTMISSLDRTLHPIYFSSPLLWKVIWSLDRQCGTVRHYYNSVSLCPAYSAGGKSVLGVFLRTEKNERCRRVRERGWWLKTEGEGEGRRRCAALEEAKQTAAWSSQEEAAARGEMFHAGDVSRSDTWVAKRKGPTQWREAESTGRHHDLQ